MKNIPNIITCLNLFAGSIACVMALTYDSYLGAFVFIVIAALFDFLDGLAARLLNAYSKIGAQLDSLADVISFGLAPGCIIFSYLSQLSAGTVYALGLPFFAFLIPIFAAIRLAKFNVDNRQTTSFLGLPVPANGLFWASFVPAVSALSEILPTFIILLIIGILILVFSLLMTSEIPMFSLKFKNLSWKGNEFPYTFVLLSILTLFFFATFGYFFLGVSVIIILYILMSVVKAQIM
jgi:CDP-diacylglycerol--serine O-phosphatidyltransferase